MTTLVEIDGVLTAPETARVPVLDRGFLYGDSVYEVLRTYEGRLFALESHLDRLEGSARRLMIDLPDRARIAAAIDRTVGSAGNPESYCRVIVTRGSGPLTLDPTTAVRPLTIVIVKEFEPFPDWTFDRGVRVMVPTIQRTSPASLDPAIKSGNYLNSVLALGEARRGGCFDALMLDGYGRVTEATSSNVFAWKDGTLLTPPLEVGILSGVTRGLLLELARELRLPCEERHLPLTDLLTADEVLLTSTLREVQPVVEVAGRPIGDGAPGPLARDLRRAFHDRALALVRGTVGR
ncbi:MAG TPA: aminotransferase class IV [Polyangia bacterium]|nr:aminotransferase class IV [Polyangia bacterium]